MPVINTNSTAKVIAGQTPLDMAMQQLGSVEAVFALALLNNMSVTADLTGGQQLSYSTTPYTKAVVDAYTANRYKPASGLETPGPNIPVQFAGVSFWGIEYTFVVS